jgi:hypothetical protein
VAHEPRYGGGGANTVRARSGPVGAWPAPTADTARRNNLRLLLGGSGGQFYFARAERQAAREDIFSHRKVYKIQLRERASGDILTLQYSAPRAPNIYRSKSKSHHLPRRDTLNPTAALGPRRDEASGRRMPP